ncbi:MAG: NosD domain-containing protein [Gemmatimonadaceae bacterium]
MKCLLLGAMALAWLPLHAQTVVPKSGLVITRSTTLRAGTYLLPAPKDSSAALITVRGSDLTVDLTGVQLHGAPIDSDPDSAAGIAILVDSGANITIRGARIRGYKVAILARGTRNLRLHDNNLSFNWKPRLYSLVEHESLVDWLSYHRNEKNEWLRYGAAIYLDGVTRGEIRGNTVHQGMNGLLATRTDSLLVWNNDFSFNSGLGIGLYRSDYNRIMHNRVDYNVRGYSEGFYRRGQDSAGILIYEQSDSNTVAFNSVTHGGDGLFVWAGQHTMDTGQGGVNDNLFFRNDFSWAPTNAMELTFSRNVVIGNRAVGSDYGLWGGYSYGSLIAHNTFERNRVGIAIEHGQDNRILGNTFHRDSTQIWLWANRVEPGDWGYPKQRDTRSRDYIIANNTMSGGRVAFRVADTRDVIITANAVRADSMLVIRGDTADINFDSVSTARIEVDTAPVKPLPGGYRALPSEYEIWSRSSIIVDEWGPYDWKSPRLWPKDSSTSSPLTLRVLTPLGMGSWRVLRARGAKVSPMRGGDGDSVVVTPDTAAAIEDWEVTLEYRGRPTRSPRGVSRPANAPYVFGYSRFDPGLTWDVKVYAWDDSTHPVNADSAFTALVRGDKGPPVINRSEQRLDYMWYRPRISGWPEDKYGVAATASVNLPAGAYSIRAIGDDGIRVYVDGRRVIDDWSVHESRVREVPLPAGKHDLRVEYFQGDGWAELRVEIVKR